MANTQISSLDAIIQTIVGEVIYTQRHKTVMRQLVRVIDWPEGKGQPLDLPKVGTLTANALTEAVDMANPQTVTDSKVTITPAEVGLQCILTDRMINRAPPGFNKMVADEMARAYAAKMDTDLVGLFSGFANGAAGSTASMTVGQIGAARARVKGNATEPAPDPVYCVLHPYQAWDIQAALVLVPAATYATPDMAGVSEEVIRSAKLGKLFGMEVYEDGYIVPDSGDDAYGAVFSKEAIVLVVVDEGTVRPERDESLRATELNLVGEYGYGERTDVFGYYLFTDAAEPTA